MNVQYINIERAASYAKNAGQLTGKIKFVGEDSEIIIQLDTQLSEEVLRLCAISLSRAAKSMAEKMTTEVFENAGLAIEDKSA